MKKIEAAMLKARDDFAAQLRLSDHEMAQADAVRRAIALVLCSLPVANVSVQTAALGMALAAMHAAERLEFEGD